MTTEKVQAERWQLNSSHIVTISLAMVTYLCVSISQQTSRNAMQDAFNAQTRQDYIELRQTVKDQGEESKSRYEKMYSKLTEIHDQVSAVQSHVR